MEKVKQNIPLYVGLALPVIMIILVTLAIYLPRVLSSAVPQYDFLYMVNTNYSGCSSYGVQMGHVVKFENQTEQCKNWKVVDGSVPAPDTKPAVTGTTPVPVAVAPYNMQPDVVQFFRHNVKTNITTEISFTEATQLNLLSSALSPDGFEVKQRGGSAGIFGDVFGGGSYADYQNRYMVGHGQSVKLDLHKSPDGMYYEPQFLGWVMP